MLDLADRLAAYPRVTLSTAPTPIEEAARLGESLGVRMLLKRDDLTSIPFGGNKVRQLEFYFGEARAQGADTVLITGAVQSNYARAAAAVAARLGMEAHVQLEERVPGMGETYYASGNVLLDDLLGAVRHSFPEGENEAGADAALGALAAELRAAGRHPYIIPLSPDNPPLGALGYVAAAAEILQQMPDLSAEVDAVVVPSGSSLTHSGLLTGLRALDQGVSVYGICVRRDAVSQHARVLRKSSEVTALLGAEGLVRDADVRVFDDVLAPGYGRLNDEVFEAIALTARTEALYLDPTYTGRTMAGLIHLVRTGAIEAGSTVMFIHTGGTPALFAYEPELRARLDAAR
ncbi:MAG: D-cysteine desulfhydrase family protein [Chloroflexi bacterium]|nr:D-cysteine desulfhydrase family protein [Chloroflexota bacterium]MDA1147987.1 D-cysteine desulfhydrase family protein [Chloroflexota bacterium]